MGIADTLQSLQIRQDCKGIMTIVIQASSWANDNTAGLHLQICRLSLVSKMKIVMSISRPYCLQPSGLVRTSAACTGDGEALHLLITSSRSYRNWSQFGHG